MDLKSTILQTLEELDFEEENQNCNKEFLEDIHEKLSILFEGLQSPNTENLETKLDVTLNFLQYLLIKIEEKLNE